MKQSSMQQSSRPSPSSYTLGIDLGTASVAVAAASNGEVRVLDGLIFGDSNNPKTLEPNHMTRKALIRQREQAQRRRGRWRRLALAFDILAGKAITPAGNPSPVLESNAWALRDKALRAPLTNDELLAVLYHISKHRGFVGRQDDEDPQEGRKVRAGIERAEQIIAEQKHKHPGQPMTFGRAVFLHFQATRAKWRRRVHTFFVKVKNGKAVAVDASAAAGTRMTYVRRARIEEEVDAILAAQRQWHPWLDSPIPRERFDAAARVIVEREDATAADMALVGWHYHYVDGGCRKDPNPLPETWAGLLRGIVFWSRPRKPHLHNIGGCDYYPEERRVSAAHPLAERYRLLELVAHQRWIDDAGVKVPLSPQEQAALLEVLRTGQTDKNGFVSWEIIREALANVSPSTAGWRLAHQTEKAKRGLKGEITRKVWAKHGLLDAWDALDAVAQGAVIEVLADHLVSAEAVMESEAERAALRDVALGLPGGAAAWAFIEDMIASGSLALPEALGLPKKRVSLGKTALMRLCTMIEDGIHPKDAQDRLAEDVGKDLRTQVARFHGRADDASVSMLEVLDYLRQRQRIPQHVWRPLFHALRRIETVVGRMGTVVGRMGGPPQAVRFEMMRELGMGQAKREQIVKRQNANEKGREKAQTEIEQALGRPATGRDVLRFLLWESQHRICPYTGRTMGLAEALEAEIEHIRLDSRGGSNKVWNLLLVAPEANRARGAYPSPLQAMQAGALDRATVEAACLRIAREINPQIASIEDMLAIAQRKKDSPPDKGQRKNGRRNGNGNAAEPHFMLRKLARVLTWDGATPPAGQDEGTDAAMLRRYAATGYMARLLRQILAVVWPDVTDVLCVRGEITARLRREKGLERVLFDVRREAGLPVDPSPLPTGWERIDAHAQDRIALERFDKRCDHRHHLLDAMVLATTQRGEYQEAVRRRDGEGNPASRYAPEPGQAHPLAAQARRWIAGRVMWHKPDRLPAGKWRADNRPKSTDIKAIIVIEKSFARKVLRNGKESVVQHVQKWKQPQSNVYACLAVWPAKKSKSGAKARAGVARLVRIAEFNKPMVDRSTGKPKPGGLTYGAWLRKMQARGKVRLYFKGDLLGVPGEAGQPASCWRVKKFEANEKKAKAIVVAMPANHNQQVAGDQVGGDEAKTQTKTKKPSISHSIPKPAKVDFLRWQRLTAPDRLARWGRQRREAAAAERARAASPPSPVAPMPPNAEQPDLFG